MHHSEQCIDPDSRSCTANVSCTRVGYGGRIQKHRSH